MFCCLLTKLSVGFPRAHWPSQSNSQTGAANSAGGWIGLNLHLLHHPCVLELKHERKHTQSSLSFQSSGAVRKIIVVSLDRINRAGWRIIGGYAAAFKVFRVPVRSSIPFALLHIVTCNLLPTLDLASRCLLLQWILSWWSCTGLHVILGLV